MLVKDSLNRRSRRALLRSQSKWSWSPLLLGLAAGKVRIGKSSLPPACRRPARSNSCSVAPSDPSARSKPACLFCRVIHLSPSADLKCTDCLPWCGDGLAMVYFDANQCCEAYAQPRVVFTFYSILGRWACGLTLLIEIIDETAGDQFTNEFRFHKPLWFNPGRYRPRSSELF